MLLQLPTFPSCGFHVEMLERYVADTQQCVWQDVVCTLAQRNAQCPRASSDVRANTPLRTDGMQRCSFSKGGHGCESPGAQAQK